MKYTKYFFVLCFTLNVLLVWGQENYVPGQGVNASNEHHSLKIAGRVQSRATAQYYQDSSFDSGNYAFIVRRARFKLNSTHFDGLISTKIELGFSTRDLGVPENVHYTFLDRTVLDAVVRIQPFENFIISLGQTKLPGNRQRLFSSGDMELVDRSILNGRMAIGRDLGGQLSYQWCPGEKIILKHTAAFTQGEGKNITLGNRGGFNYTFKTEIFPLGAFKNDGAYVGSDIYYEPKPKLAVAASYDYNQSVSRTKGQEGDFIDYSYSFWYQKPLDIQTVFLDAHFKWQGFSLLFESGFKYWTDHTEEVLLGENKAYSIHLQPGYTFDKKWNISLRYALYTDQFLNNQEVRLGASRYIYGHKLKVQTDVGYISSSINQNFFMGRLQFEVHF